jgi:uncharacterized membrane protein (DUF4010 family)
MTSVPALVLTCALGILCLSDQRPLALALAVVVTGILAFKVPLHSFVQKLSAAEIAAAVKFGLLSLVLLPLLPDRDYGPRDWPWLADRLRGLGVADATLARLQPVNPHQLLLIVVAISGAGFAGYVLVRLLGPRRGLLLTGIAGGIVSSTAVTLAMAEQSRRTPEWRRPLAAAVLAACSVMSLRVLVVSSALDGNLLAPLVLPLGLLLLGNLGAASFLARRHGGTITESDVRVGTPLAFGPALRLTGLIFVIRVLSEIAVLAFGDAGLVVLAALSGAVDVDAITVAASQQAAAGQVATGLAAAAIGTAVAANTLFKGAFVLATGDRATGRTAAAALLLTLLAGLLGLLLSFGFGIGR